MIKLKIATIGIAFVMLTSCSGMTGMFDDVEKSIVETSQCVCVEIDKQAMQADTDIEVSVNITNKDVPPPAPVINVHAAPTSTSVPATTFTK